MLDLNRIARGLTIGIGILSLGLASCGGESPPAGPPPVAGPPGAAEPAPPTIPPPAATMSATIYDDGLACPGNCDAHVVFHPDHNGTANAFAPPLRARAAPRKCRNGEACIICFGPEEASCLEATYRGSGPPRGRFDFTPAFFDAACRGDDLPSPLAAKCTSLDRAVARHGYDRLVNCISEPGHPACADVMATARSDKAADAAERAVCKELGGDAAYNAQQSDASRHRTHGCNYFKNRRETNSRGVSWVRLAPGSCRPETYVGRDGLDCCSASSYAAAALHPECRPFFKTR